MNHNTLGILPLTQEIPSVRIMHRRRGWSDNSANRCKRAGITRIKFHELRHTCASVMAKPGVMPRYAQDRLGHADVSLTMNTYTHVLPDARAEVATKIEEVIV